MVVSDVHKYVFVELYFTGSTSIHKELCELYDGKSILNKHAKYYRFLQIANEEQKNYFVFSGIRNPMDMVVTSYLKLMNDPYRKYANAEEWRKAGQRAPSEKQVKKREKFVRENLTFQQYFKKYYKLPYDNWSSLNHSKFNHIIRFENIQEDFSELLKKLNIEQKRKLPHRNKTEGKKNFEDYYTSDIRRKAIFIFGPFMQKWGYTFPEDWNVKKIDSLSLILFQLSAAPRKFFWRCRISINKLISYK